jgi:hypothetical protein
MPEQIKHEVPVSSGSRLIVVLYGLYHSTPNGTSIILPWNDTMTLDTTVGLLPFSTSTMYYSVAVLSVWRFRSMIGRYLRDYS